MPPRVCTLRPVCNLRKRLHAKRHGHSSFTFPRQPAIPPRRAPYAPLLHGQHARRGQHQRPHPTHESSAKINGSMARIKNFPPAKPPQRAKLNTPPTIAKHTPFNAAIELGASNDQATEKKPGGEWELVRWAQGVGASSVGGAEAIPAMTAIRKSGQTREMLHGHAAVRARKRNPNDWEMFAYPKLVFMDEATTPNIQRTLDLQKEKAEALGTTPREIAIAFFRHVISEVIGNKKEAFKIHINISDRWPNRNVQDLMMSLQGLKANVDFEHVDECLSSIIGRIPNDASGVYVVIDCGHSGMNAGFAEVAPGPKYKVHHWKDYHAGAGEINMAVEDAVRKINTVNGVIGEANVWEVSECIDEFFKPEPEADIDPRCGLSQSEWDEVMGHADLANRHLDRRRVNLTRPIIAEALGLANRSGEEVGLHVLLTGRGSRSPTLLKAFRNLIDEEFPAAKLHEDKRSKITAVLEGLMRIADNPSILSAKEVPVSLWLRSDPDESPDQDNHGTVVRICTQGQSMNDKTKDRVSASHPVHFELSVDDDEPPLLDLSVFGTPTNASDDDIIVGWNKENFAYTDVGRVTEFGRFEQRLPRSTIAAGKRTCHVYLYVEVSRLSVEFYAIFAHDGRAIKPLEKVPLIEALEGGELSTKWKKYQTVDLGVVRLRQVARPETLSANPREPSASGSRPPKVVNSPESLGSKSRSPDDTNSPQPSVPTSQQLSPTDNDVSPLESRATQPDEPHIDRRSRKRTSSLPKSNQTKRRTVSSLAARKKKPVSKQVLSDTHSTEDDKTDSESEMEM